MYERFTDKALKVMQLANYEAQRFNHEFIGTEHILLGLIKEGSGVAAIVLKSLDIGLLTIRREVERIDPSLPELPVRGKLPLTPRAKKILEFGMEESRILNPNYDYVGTEHILLGLLREQEGVATEVLRRLGLNVADVREEIIKLRGDSAEFVPMQSPRPPSWPPLIRPDSQPVDSAVTAIRSFLSKDQDPSSLFERFTDRSRNAMQLANQEAQRFNHENVGTEHILLGLVKLGSGVAAVVLKNLDVDLRKIRIEVEKIVQSGQDMVSGKLPLTPRAKTAINFATEEARFLNHNYVGTEHLLLGLLREQEGVAAHVLINLGLKLEDVRTEVLNLLGHGL